MRKVDIRTRTFELDEQLKTGRATMASQSDERDRLVQACRSTGDHVFALRWLGGMGVGSACQFCNTLERSTDEMVARNLQRA